MSPPAAAAEVNRVQHLISPGQTEATSTGSTIFTPSGHALFFERTLSLLLIDIIVARHFVQVRHDIASQRQVVHLPGQHMKIDARV